MTPSEPGPMPHGAPAARTGTNAGGGGAGAPLDSCDFDFDADGFMELPANERHASHWMWQAAPRVRFLRLRIIEFNQEPTPLSNLHLVSQHLTRLELVGVGVNDSVLDFFRTTGDDSPGSIFIK